MSAGSAIAADVDRCRVRFRDSIYGARPYNQPWLFPFTGRIILIADSIRLNGRLVGIDKVNHFIREGLSHWRDAREPAAASQPSCARNLVPPGRQFRWNEYGLKGWSLTGVLAYSDLAASYSGYRFWSDHFVDRPAGVARRPSRRLPAGSFRRRPFMFAEYVTDAMDEGHQLFGVSAGPCQAGRNRTGEAHDDMSGG